MSSNRKRVYESGTSKRAEKKRKIEAATTNTKSISSFFERNAAFTNSVLTSEETESIREAGVETEPLPESSTSTSTSIASAQEPQSHEISNKSATIESAKSLEIQFDPSKTCPTDRGHFCETINDSGVKRLILEHGPCRPTDGFEQVNADGSMTTNFSERYYNKYISNISVPRLWLCYSKELRKPYCEVCWLFADRSLHNYESQRGWINGVPGTGHNLLEKIKRHENSSMHIEAAALYSRWKSGKPLDEENERKLRINSLFWVKVLNRVITIILTLASLSLAFRGLREEYKDGICDGGNFLGLVALLAEYDEVLSEVVALPARATKYLSDSIQNELIDLLAKAVRSSLVKKINASPFWSIILDSTSDVSRVDQLSVVIRWVQIEGDNCSVVESFMGFVKVTSPDAKGIASTAKNFIETLGIDFGKIRGQGYDGASVMSGVHAGVQSLIQEASSSPVPFVHCGCHNLNLVINDAVDSVVENKGFFGVLKEIFNYFGQSLNRWEELRMEADPGSLTLKRLCETRWSSRVDAVRAVRDRYPHIMKILTRLALTSTKKKERDDAKFLKEKMDSYEFILFIVIWERILRAINSTSKELQSPKLDLSIASRLLSCTVSELEILRGSWDSVRKTASALAESWSSSLTFTQRRRRRVKRFFDEWSEDECLTDAEESFKVRVFYKTVDTALMQLRIRFKGQSLVTSLFSFLYPKSLVKCDITEIAVLARKIIGKCEKDFTECLETELRSFVKEFRPEIEVKESVTDIANLMLESRVSSSFPEVYKLVLLFVTIPVTVATAERSFSKLKLIKTYLRSAISQERLDNLAVLSIENTEAKAIDKTNLIRNVACLNARRQKRIRV